MSSFKKILAISLLLGFVVTFAAPVAAGPDFDINGRLHLDGAVHSSDEAEFSDGLNERRVWLGAVGSIDENWDGFITADLAGNDVTLADVWLRRDLSPGNLWIGQFKQPQGMHFLTSSNEITFMERSPVITALSPLYRLGAGYELPLEDATVTATAFGRNISDDVEADTDMPLGGALRATHNRELGDGLLHLGASVSYEEFDRVVSKTIGEQPELRGADGGSNLVEAEVEDVDDILRSGVELAYIDGPLSFEAEYLNADFSTDNDTEPTFNGYHLQASYVFGGRRAYSGGVIGGVERQEAAAWELAARYSSLDLVDEGLEGGEMNNVTLGVNYYPSDNVRFMTNLVFVDVEDAGDVDDLAEDEDSSTIGGFRVQYNF